MLPVVIYTLSNPVSRQNKSRSNGSKFGVEMVVVVTMTVRANDSFLSFGRGPGSRSRSRSSDQIALG